MNKTFGPGYLALSHGGLSGPSWKNESVKSKSGDDGVANESEAFEKPKTTDRNNPAEKKNKKSSAEFIQAYWRYHKAQRTGKKETSCIITEKLAGAKGSDGTQCDTYQLTTFIRAQKRIEFTRLLLEKEGKSNNKSQSPEKAKKMHVVEFSNDEGQAMAGAASKKILPSRGKQIVFSMPAMYTGLATEAQAVFERNKDIFNENNPQLAFDLHIFKTVYPGDIQIANARKISGENLHALGIFNPDKRNSQSHAALRNMVLTSLMTLGDKIGEMHARGIAHRDIKPHNIMFDPALRKDKIRKINGKEFFCCDGKRFDVNDPKTPLALIEHAIANKKPPEEFFDLEKQKAYLIDWESVADGKCRINLLRHNVETPLYLRAASAVNKLYGPNDQKALIADAIRNDNFAFLKVCLDVGVQNAELLSRCFKLAKFKSEVDEIDCVEPVRAYIPGLANDLKKFIDEKHISETIAFLQNSGSANDKQSTLLFSRIRKRTKEAPSRQKQTTGPDKASGADKPTQKPRRITRKDSDEKVNCCRVQ